MPPEAFVRENTCPVTCTLVPELRLHLAHESRPLWHLSEPELDASGLPPPYWAFAWSGGQGLARYLLDHPHEVAGQRVLDFASGSGVVALAAARAGAHDVLAADVDRLATAACQVNAHSNGLCVRTTEVDLIGTPTDAYDVIVAGDVFYEQPMAHAVGQWLGQARRQGAKVIIGDPGRRHLPPRLHRLALYHLPTAGHLEDTEFRTTAVWKFD